LLKLVMKKKNNNTDKKLNLCGENHILREFIKEIRTLNFALFNQVINLHSVHYRRCQVCKDLQIFCQTSSSKTTYFQELKSKTDNFVILNILQEIQHIISH